MNVAALPRILSQVHKRNRVTALNSSNCRHQNAQRELRNLLAEGDGVLSISAEGVSIEGRAIPVVRYGHGPVTILLWSQMHGDEPTATLALFDIFRFLASNGPSEIGMPDFGQRCSIYAIPMLNPDGAQRASRYTAAMIDMNRDARRLRTPEARFLQQIQKHTRPQFGFNLHDQELSSVGQSNVIAAIALLAPAGDAGSHMTAVRKRAIQVAAGISDTIETISPGRLSRYDDTHEPRAFGDMMQAWGTSTVLIESGHWKGDPGKEMIRTLNFAAILSSIQSIASGEYRRASAAHYHDLPQNGKRAFDLIFRKVTVMNRDGSRFLADLGMRTDWRKGSSGTIRVRVCEVGDLTGFGSVFELPGNRSPVQAAILTPNKVLSLSSLARKLHITLPPVAC